MSDVIATSSSGSTRISSTNIINSTPGSSQLDHVALPVVRRWRLVVARDLHYVKHDASVRAAVAGGGGAARGVGEAVAAALD